MSRPLLAEAASWRLLSCLLERPRAHWRDEILALATEVADEPLAACARRAAEEATEGSYLAVLGPGGTVSPREVAYHSDIDPAVTLTRLHTMYQAFAFAPASEDPPDHIAVELGFVGFLALKGAWAAHEGNEEARALVVSAAALFRREHLEPFLAALCPRVVSSGSYLAPVAGYLAAAVRHGGLPAAG